jgi:small subunit ribosomal protein S17
MRERGLRKTQTGIVVSDKMDKTVVVQVDRLVRHPVYKKYVRRRAKYKAHDGYIHGGSNPQWSER